MLFLGFVAEGSKERPQDTQVMGTSGLCQGTLSLKLGLQPQVGWGPASPLPGTAGCTRTQLRPQLISQPASKATSWHPGSPHKALTENAPTYCPQATSSAGCACLCIGGSRSSDGNPLCSGRPPSLVVKNMGWGVRWTWLHSQSSHVVAV